MLPSAAIGKEGFHATSHRKPSGSAKNPWRPKKIFRASLIIVAPASAASASTASTCSSSPTLCASETRENAPCSTASTPTPSVTRLTLGSNARSLSSGVHDLRYCPADNRHSHRAVYSYSPECAEGLFRALRAEGFSEVGGGWGPEFQ